MNTPFTPLSRWLLLAALPAALLTTACGKDDKDETPAPVVDKGKVLFSHSAASANVRVKALVGDTEVGQLDYGQSSGYYDVTAGSQTFKVNVASSNVTAAQQTVTVEKDKNYSVFAYPTSATAVALLTTTDDLTAPASGQAKIRLVHAVLSGPSTVKLSQMTAAGTVDIANASTGFAAASGFVSIPAGSYNLLVTTGTASTPVAYVGDGSGSGSTTSTKNYEAGKIYTVVVRGLVGSLDPNLGVKAAVIQHN